MESFARRAFLLSALLIAGCAAPASRLLPADTPEAQGVSSKGIRDFVDGLEKEVDAVHSLVLVRHGRTIARGTWAPFKTDAPHMLYSLSKSFTSTAVGLAVAEGRMGVDDKVLSFFPGDGPERPSDTLKAMRVRDLLTMSTGHAKDSLRDVLGSPNWPRAFLAKPVEHEPGTHFVYNSGATYMLSAIVQKVTGQSVLDYLGPRLFEPLGIAPPTWETDPRGVNTGGWGLKVTPGDIARFGQLYLRKGMWNGRRLLPAAWIHDATSAQIANGKNPDSDWNQGYGYQFWRTRHNAYRGDGAFGQFCLVLPDQDAVLAMTSGTRDMQRILNLVFTHLLPAMHPGPLPADPASRAALEKRLAALRFAPVAGAATSPVAAKVSGRRFAVDANPLGITAVSFAFSGSSDVVTIHRTAGDRTYRAGRGSWRQQEIRFDGLGLTPSTTNGPQPVAASGAWTAPDRYALTAWLHETPFRVEFGFTFDRDGAGVTVRRRLHPMQKDEKEIRGRAR